jgi:hypothetical protein
MKVCTASVSAKPWIRRSLLLMLATALCPISGCSSDDVPTPAGTDARLYQVSKGYRATHSGEPVDSFETLKKILQDMYEAGINGDPSEILKSSRDGEPFVILFSDAKSKSGQLPDSLIVAYEKIGVEGERYILTMDGKVLLLTDAQFDKSQFYGGKKPSNR